MFLIIEIFKVDGIYNSTDSTFKIDLKVWDNDIDQPAGIFTHSPSFDLNEWVYIGASIHRTDRLGSTYDFHIASRTSTGVENQDSFLAQDISFQCNFYNLNKGLYLPNTSSIYFHTIGDVIAGSKIKFTGIVT